MFEIYEKITGENAYKTPMRIYPAVHYTMGGLWVDYNLMSNVPGLHVIGEANFSDHGANRLGASALMQGLADGYFVLPYTLPNYLAGQIGKRPSTDHPEFQEGGERRARDASNNCLTINGKRSRRFDSIANSVCFSGTNAAWPATPTGLREALAKIPAVARRILEQTSAFPATAKISINRSNAPDASPISWSSPN